MEEATPQSPPTKARSLGARADSVFLRIEVFAYIILGALLAIAALLGVLNAGVGLIETAQHLGDLENLIDATEALLFVLVLVEILHTVRASFRAGALAAEPFLIVGLIASIRRVLAITLESSRVTGPSKWTPQSQAILAGSLMELGVLAGLILIMVVAIFILRRSERPAED